MPANQYLTTGRPILGTPMADSAGADGIVFFGRYALSPVSPTLRVGANPVVLKVYGLLASESVAINNLQVATGATAPLAQNGTTVALAPTATTIVLSLAGSYQLVAMVAALGMVTVTATELPLSHVAGEAASAPRSQVALPNPYLNSTTTSPVAQITSVPWVYRAYGLPAGTTIAVLNVTTQNGVVALAPYTKDGGAQVFDANTTTIVLDVSGSYQFQLSGTAAGVLLIGNETPIVYFDPYALPASLAQAVANAAASAASAAASVVQIEAIVAGLPAPISTIAQTNLTYPAVVAIANGVAYYPNLLVPTDVANIVGLTMHAAAMGASVLVSTDAQFTEPAWSWLPGSIFCTVSGGGLTQAAPTTGAVVEVAKAISSTTIQTGIQLVVLR